jgi:hypothetical protein
LSNPFTLSGTNIVILARNYNPSIVSKEWLYDKNIVRETVTNFVHTPPLSVIETDRVSFVLDENRLQISLKSITTDSIESLPKIAAGFVSCLPETPFVAVGFNYSYSIPKETSHLKTLFALDDIKLKQLFSENYEVGLIVSFSFKAFIVRMTAPPPPARGKITRITMDFNFHSDSRGAGEVKKRLKLYPETIEKTEEILRGLSE